MIQIENTKPIEATELANYLNENLTAEMIYGVELTDDVIQVLVNLPTIVGLEPILVLATILVTPDVIEVSIHLDVNEQVKAKFEDEFAQLIKDALQ
jgi:hypothetical protein